MKKGAISTCKPVKGQFLSSYFLREKANGEKRFIFNLRKLNEFIVCNHFQMEDRKTVIRLITKNAYLATIDLKDAFFLIPITKRHRKYLRFTFQGKLFEFNCLPFGLCTAPLTFTKIVKVVMEKLRRDGMITVIYIDDILFINRSKKMCQTQVIKAIALFESLGFIINKDKSAIVPKQQCKYLGFDYDTVKFQISLPKSKRRSIEKSIRKFINKTDCKIRDWAQLVGTLVAACPATKYGTMYIKNLERCKYVSLTNNNSNTMQK